MQVIVSNRLKFMEAWRRTQQTQKYQFKLAFPVDEKKLVKA
jgi:hypothetical protein